MYTLLLSNRGFIELRKGMEGTVVLDVTSVDEGNIHNLVRLVLERDEVKQLSLDLVALHKEG